MTNAPRKIVIIYGNDRPDIRLIYDEVADQARRNGIDVCVYLPGKKKFERPTAAPALGPLVPSRFLDPHYVGATWRAVRTPERFFNSGRMRGWTVVDYVSFQCVVEREKPDFVFCLNQRHSQGAVFACEDAGIQVITHQHGDYYHAKGTRRCIEGESGCCLVWHDNAARSLSKIRVNQDIAVAGSIKHIRLLRERFPARAIRSLLFLDTYSLDLPFDLERAREEAELLANVTALTQLPCYIQYHPIRAIDAANGHHRLIRKIYENKGLRPVIGTPSAESLAIANESNAIYDMIARGLPCIYLLDKKSILSLGRDFPSTVGRRGLDVAKSLASKINDIAVAPETARAKQLAHIQTHVVGTQEILDAAFANIFATRSPPQRL